MHKDELTEVVLKQQTMPTPTWEYDRIEGALTNIGHTISDTSIGDILKAHGIEPAHRPREVEV